MSWPCRRSGKCRNPWWPFYRVQNSATATTSVLLCIRSSVSVFEVIISNHREALMRQACFQGHEFTRLISPGYISTGIRLQPRKRWPGGGTGSHRSWVSGLWTTTPSRETARDPRDPPRLVVLLNAFSPLPAACYLLPQMVVCRSRV